MTPRQQADLLHEANRLWLATLSSLAADDWDAPSGLPGWTRAHVAAHVALNGEGLARALRGAATGTALPMYDSATGRDLDIETLATTGGEVLQDRNRAAVDAFDRAWAGLSDPPVLEEIERTPGGPTFTVTSVIGRRLSEVAIHHADLGTRWTSSDWAPAFAEWVVDQRAGRVPRTTFRATDSGRSWPAADAEVEVSGHAAALAWWLTGRGAAEGLTSSTGVLPPTPSY